jgi:hypothetical protein
VGLRPLKVYRSVRASALVFRSMTVLNLTGAGFALALGGLRAPSVGATVFILATTVLFRWRRLRESPFGLLFGVNLSIYFILPLVFLSLMGENFEYGQAGLSTLPADHAVLARSTLPALLFLTLCVVALACGLAFAKTSVREEAPHIRRRYSQVPVEALAIVVLALTFVGNNLAFARIAGVQTSESLLRFIFFDHAYLILFPIVISLRLARRRQAQSSSTEASFLFILVGFLLVATLATSKGFILVIFLFSFIFPLSMQATDRSSRCFLPTAKLLVVSSLGAALIFIATADLRSIRAATDDVAALARGVSEALRGSNIREEAKAIVYRLGAPVDRYMLLFHRYLWNGPHDTDYAGEYLSYSARSLGNLALPGTPFPDAYVPTGNLYPAALEKRPLLGTSSEAELARSLNTQPYTIFGVAIIVGGTMAPVLLLVSAALLSMFYRGRGLAGRLSLLYLFHATLHSYGFEVGVANAMRVWVSLLAFLFIAYAVRVWQGTLRYGTASP